MKPFLKWAGGKTQLLNIIEQELPKDIDSITIYVEPFVGAGSVFLKFIDEDKFEKYIINDINYKLINTYKVIRDDLDLLLIALNEIKEKFSSFTESSEERKEMYYEIREKFNSDDIGNIESAAYFIFLNKTCFNGLYRENSKGGFNVPVGSYKNPSIFDKELLIEISELLNKTNSKGEKIVEILNGDYSKLDKYISNNTFIYFDPPYRPVTIGGFTTYDKSGFNDKSQIALAHFYREASLSGAKLMLSNSDPKNLDKNDTFFDTLYGGFNIKRISANRAINSKGCGRGAINELLITNY